MSGSGWVQTLRARKELRQETLPEHPRNYQRREVPLAVKQPVRAR